MTTLENSYCVPKGEEWDIFGKVERTYYSTTRPSELMNTFVMIIENAN